MLAIHQGDRVGPVAGGRERVGGGSSLWCRAHHGCAAAPRSPHTPKYDTPDHWERRLGGRQQQEAALPPALLGQPGCSALMWMACSPGPLVRTARPWRHDSDFALASRSPGSPWLAPSGSTSRRSSGAGTAPRHSGGPGSHGRAGGCGPCSCTTSRAARAAGRGASGG